MADSDPAYLAAPTEVLLDRLEGRKVFEIGSGNGKWLRALEERGIDAIGVDIRPKRATVMKADHTALRRFPDRDLVLIVWPPDDVCFDEWLGDWSGDVLVVGEHGRFFVPDTFVEQWRENLPPGHKGGNRAVLFRRNG